MNIKRLSASQLQLPTSVGVLYTAPAGKRSRVIVVCHNATGSAATMTLYWPTSDAANRRFYESLAANSTVMVEPKLPITLEAGESIYGVSGTATAINVEITGDEETL